MESLTDLLLNAADLNQFSHALHQYICLRFKLAKDTGEHDIRQLAILSIKMMTTGHSQARLESMLASSDCHQISLVVQKKILIIMELEKILGVRLKQDELDRIDTTTQCAEALYSHFRPKG